MIGLLVLRTLAGRPRRTLLLLLGFGIAVGVMITLLSIGAAVLEQARDADLVGGGDIVVLPTGVDVEVLKVGGATGMFYTIDNARFVFRQVLSGPRFQRWLAPVPAPVWPGEPASPPLAAASPMLANEVVYLRAHGRSAIPRRAAAFGVIPSLDRAVGGTPADARGVPLAWEDSHADRIWMDPPADSLFNAIDRFHVPPAGRADLDHWAEWLYFNFQDPATGAVGFVSFIAAGDWPAGRGRAVPIVQIVPLYGEAARVATELPLAPGDVRTDRCELRFGANTKARFEAGAWHLQLDVESPHGRARGAILVVPVRDLDYPPILIHEGADLISGYTVPAVRARATGWLEVDNQRLDLDGAPAYHDHNWGTWRDFHWDWGTASTWEHGLFYGRIEHPALRLQGRGPGLVALLSRARTADARGGFVALFRPEALRYEWNEAPPDLPGSPRRVPTALSFGVDGVDTNDPAVAKLTVRAKLDAVVASPPAAGEAPRVFLQARGRFDVAAVVDGDSTVFHAPGFAEVFVESRADSVAGR
jgi:hypothetical protein